MELEEKCPQYSPEERRKIADIILQLKRSVQSGNGYLQVVPIQVSFGRVRSLYSYFIFLHSLNF